MAAEIINRQQALCLTGPPSCLSLWVTACCSTALLVVMLQVARDMTAVTLLEGAPSCDWAYAGYIHPHPLPPPCVPFPHSWLGCMQECLVSPPVRKSVVSVNSPMACVRVCLCACMQVYCAALCVYCSRTQRDGLSQWRAPV